MGFLDRVDLSFLSPNFTTTGNEDFSSGISSHSVSGSGGGGGGPRSSGPAHFVTLSLFSTFQSQQQLFFVLLAQYLVSSTFRSDMTAVLCDPAALGASLRSNFNLQKMLHSYGSLAMEKLTFRSLQLLISSLCAHTNSPFLQDAAVCHYVYPIIQEYRFGRSAVTRGLRWLASCCYPQFLRELFGFGPPSGGGGLGSGSEALEESLFLYAPPRPPRGDASAVYAGMPPAVATGLQYTQALYATSPLYAIAANAFVTEAAALVLDQGVWAYLAYRERGRRTSPQRLLKPYLASFAGRGVQLACQGLARWAGALLGRRFGSEPTGAAVFWTEALVLLASTPVVLRLTFAAQQAARDWLEARWPATEADEEQNAQEQQEEEEEARAAQAFMNSMFGSLAGGSGGPDEGSNTNNTNTGSNEAPMRFDKSVNYYVVLNISETATPAEIKKSYRQAALKNHPDRVGNDPTARDRMALLNDAYDTLINEGKRMQYDASRRLAANPGRALVFLEGLSPVALTAVTVGGSAAGFALAGAAVHCQWVLLFARATAPGCGGGYY